ncbi:MAG TPA: tripartite tricarboxylate transporter substrate binding protein [Xanthobacteraceae bacterium]|nr:tripartite tricarboxylate transporter substrate binding protein [Xanthobacteraceae bacterium]
MAAVATALPVAPRIASALDYPTRPVHLVVGFPAGGSPNLVARVIGHWLSTRLGEQFVVEPTPGAGSNIGTEKVVRAAPDGYTLLLMTAANTINASLYRHLDFNFQRDIAPVGMIGAVPFVMEVNPTFPAKTIPEFVKFAKANPGKVIFASHGVGTATHVFGALFEMMTGVSLLHVPYRGSYMPDLLSGRVQAVFDPLPQAISYIRTGKLRALAVTTTTSVNVLPSVPTLDQFVPGYAASGWLGVGAPKNTAPEVVDKLNKEINAALNDASFKSQLSGLGVDPTSMTPAALEKFIADETKKWRKVVKFASIKPA